MVSQSSTPSEIEIWFNRASVALAKSERLMSGLLPPPTESELKNAKTEEQVRKEEQEMFTVAPDLLGVGAPLPQQGEENQPNQTANDKLKRQLLGADYKKIQERRAEPSGKIIKSRGSHVSNGPKHATQIHGVKNTKDNHRLQPTVSRSVHDLDSDDEPGRSSLGKSRSMLQHIQVMS